MAGIDSIRGVVGFVETVAAGSFAGAAKALGVTPVAVSKNVQRLEQKRSEEHTSELKSL